MKKRTLSLVLALVLCLSLLPMAALAAEQTVVYAHNEEELNAALKQSNVKIVLDGKDYRNSYIGESPDQWLGSAWVIEAQENVTIQGTTGTRLLVDSRDAPVLYISKGKNITLENITAGHTDAAVDEIFKGDDCVNPAADVIYMEREVSNVTIRNCDLYGCGYTGIDCGRKVENLNVYDTTIHDCSHNALSGVSGSFYNCRFLQNGRDQLLPQEERYARDVYPESCISGWRDDDKVNFYNCEFTGNYNSEFTNYGVGQIYLENCTFQSNWWLNTDPKLYGYPSTQEVELDGKKVTFNLCALKDSAGNQTNYVKIRDVASALNGTPAQFNVEWLDCVNVATGQSYAADGSEGNPAPGFYNRHEVQVSQTPTSVDNVMMDLDAVLYTDYTGGGHTFYKLRDLGKALGFNVDWSAERGVYIETDKPYQG